MSYIVTVGYQDDGSSNVIIVVETHYDYKNRVTEVARYAAVFDQDHGLDVTEERDFANKIVKQFFRRPTPTARLVTTYDEETRQWYFDWSEKPQNEVDEADRIKRMQEEASARLNKGLLAELDD